MYAVIFTATTAVLDDEYHSTVAIMRDLAMTKYGCLDFVALSDGMKEIAISYWPNEQSIKHWKNDPQHWLAQHNGQDRWYDSYRVEVVEIKRVYTVPAKDWNLR
ncbi:antibiotic biosynthesis monooxygenase [Thalassotalea maritima]|uniref:antibiotic biosynthesis monooxygenase family protein n=1 Tax=Thalassotalea maritima TaxID=3242416 RepID=UPI003527CDB7